MKKVILAAVVVLAAVSCGKTYEQPELGARKVEIITEGKYQFKDLNKNGKKAERSSMISQLKRKRFSPKRKKSSMPVLSAPVDREQTTWLSAR